jgi:flagellar biosynthesis protein FliR
MASLESILPLIPAYVLIFFRVAAMMVFAPLFGSARIPKRVRLMLACVLALGLAPTIAVPRIPSAPWTLAMGIGGEIIFGLAMGSILSFVFVAAQWAGQIIGQQMGLNIAAAIDPEFGGQGSLIGDLYFWLTLVIFLLIDGHHAMLRGLRASFDTLPPLSVGMDRSLLDTIVGLFQASTMLAVQMAAPILVTMLVVDLALGFVGKTVPQLNVLSAGLTLRTLIGMLVLIVGISLTSDVIRHAVFHAMKTVYVNYSTPV